MGKNFSRNQKRENRNEADFYQTPHCLTRAFIDYAFIKDNLFDISYKTDFSIADFCCGKKAIGDVIRSYSITDNKEDLKLIETDLSEGVDFFSLSKEEIQNLCFGRLPDIGIMNPPFRLFNKWVEKCFEVFTVGFALLAPTTYLQGVSRFNKNMSGVFQNFDYPLTDILTFNRYPMLSKELREDRKIETGMQAISWFVFQKGLSKGRLGTAHDWLDIDEYVLRKRGK